MERGQGSQGSLTVGLGYGPVAHSVGWGESCASSVGMEGGDGVARTPYSSRLGERWAGPVGFTRRVKPSGCRHAARDDHEGGRLKAALRTPPGGGTANPGPPQAVAIAARVRGGERWMLNVEWRGRGFA